MDRRRGRHRRLPGEAQSGAAPASSRIVRRRSGTIAASMMRVSQNQYAGMLLRALVGGCDNSGSGTVAAQERWGWNSPTTATSSLTDRVCRDTTTSPPRRWSAFSRACARIRSMRRHSRSRCRLPDARARSRDGLPERRPKGKVTSEDRNGRQRARDCGLCRDGDGETLLFSIIANNFNVPASVIDAAADRALIRLAIVIHLRDDKSRCSRGSAGFTMTGAAAVRYSALKRTNASLRPASLQARASADQRSSCRKPRASAGSSARGDSARAVQPPSRVVMRRSPGSSDTSTWRRSLRSYPM